MKPSLVSAFLILATVATYEGVAAQSQPSLDWNGNFSFRSQSERANDLLQADLIERQENGYYGQWTNHQTYNTTSTGYYTTNVDEQFVTDQSTNQVTNNIGAVTSTEIQGENNTVNTENHNCGGVSGGIHSGGATGGDTSGQCP